MLAGYSDYNTIFAGQADMLKRKYTSLFTKMVVKKEKEKNTYIQKCTTNRNGSRNKE